MLERHTLRLGCCLALGILTAMTGASADTRLPDHHDGRIDGAPAVAVNPVDGATWSVWAYRDRGEFDLALSTRDPAGRWSPPEFLGARDGVDQVQPALLADASGQLHLAWAEQPTGRVLLASWSPQQKTWSVPVPLNGGRPAGAAPRLAIVADRLIAAWVETGEVRIRILPLALRGQAREEEAEEPESTIFDGPDPVNRGQGSR